MADILGPLVEEAPPGATQCTNANSIKYHQSSRSLRTTLRIGNPRVRRNKLTIPRWTEWSFRNLGTHRSRR